MKRKWEKEASGGVNCGKGRRQAERGKARKERREMLNGNEMTGEGGGMKAKGDEMGVERRMKGKRCEL